MEYTKLSRKKLEELIDKEDDRIYELKMKIIEDESKENDLGPLITALEEKVKNMMNALTDTKTFVETNQDYAYQCALTSLRLELKAIRNFEPGVMVETFVTNLENLFKLQVEPKLTSHPELEHEFVTMCQSRLHQTYQSTILIENRDFQTFADLKKYLTETYSSQMSNFQILSKLWSFELNKHESFRDGAARLDIETTNACTTVSAKYTKENASMSNPSPVLDAKGVFSLLGAMLMSEQIRVKSPSIYGHLIKRINKFSSASAIAAEAQQLSDRNVGDDSIGAQAYYGKKERSKKPKQSLAEKFAKNLKLSESYVDKLIKEKVCIRFNSKEGCKKTPCPYKHQKVARGVDNEVFYTKGSELPADWAEDTFDTLDF